MNASCNRLILACFCAVGFSYGVAAADEDREDHFERKIRPLLAQHCWKCHGAKEQEGSLRLDTARGLSLGGDSGRVIAAGEPDASLLIKAVRQTGDLKMPPDGKLKNGEIADLVKWVQSGARWPNAKPTAAPTDDTAPATAPLLPNAPQLKQALQLWVKADSLKHASDTRVYVWPDHSGHGRDLMVAKGIRERGVGNAPLWIQHSRVNGRPGVRFRGGEGLGASPDNTPVITGDAAATIMVVAKLNTEPTNDRFGNLLCIGNPAWPNNPQRALAYYLEFEKTTSNQFELDFAGGWNHDVKIGPESGNHLQQPRIITVTKNPGPMTANTHMYFDGQSTEKLFGKQLTGSDRIPDVRLRPDIGITIGKAQDWQGSLNGDVAEIIVFNRVLSQNERRGVEAYLHGKYEIFTPDMIATSTRQFSKHQKSHWSFQPVRDPKPAQAADTTHWASNPIDHFILRKLEKAGLHPAPLAARATLIRRVTYNLTGLPPTPEEIHDFLHDPSSDETAFGRLVDRLLASPRYGEHWGRHWLDVVRYADSTANDGNFVLRYAFRYRDYVVAALNRDKPYDVFIQEQLAGDLMPSADARQRFERTVATGFLLVGPKALAETDKEQVKLDIADELLDVTSRAFMGLTVSCARCHDHKFDPIPTVDYYSLAGIFRSTEMFSDLNRGASKWLEYSIPDGVHEGQIPVMAVKDGPIHNLRVHIRGSKLRLGSLAPRRFLQVIEGSGHPPVVSQSSGRWELAKWITKPEHPLTARVMVNRIWQSHFGVGLVSTSDNFGARGTRPTHPELLDWLASRFRESGWSIKSMHRLILLSSTYRQQSLRSEQSQQQRAIDPTNQWLWNMPRRRLSAEQLRDSLLAIAGRLDERIGGGQLCQQIYEAGEMLDANGGVVSASRVSRDWEGFDSGRRSIYLPVIRNGQPDVLALFDVADPNNVTARRSETTVSSQAAFMLNNQFVLENALGLARRAMTVSENDLQRLNSVYKTVLGRDPTEQESAAALSFIADLQRSKVAKPSAWQRFCHLMFCLNEFCYVE